MVMFFVAKLRCFQLFYTGKSLSACLQQITLILAFSLKKTFLLFCPSLWLFFFVSGKCFLPVAANHVDCSYILLKQMFLLRSR